VCVKTAVKRAYKKKWSSDENGVTEPFLCSWAMGPEWRRRESNRIPCMVPTPHNTRDMNGLYRSEVWCVTFHVTLLSTVRIRGRLGDSVACVRPRKTRLPGRTTHRWLLVRGKLGGWLLEAQVAVGPARAYWRSQGRAYSGVATESGELQGCPPPLSNAFTRWRVAS